MVGLLLFALLQLYDCVSGNRYSVKANLAAPSCAELGRRRWVVQGDRHSFWECSPTDAAVHRILCAKLSEDARLLFDVHRQRCVSPQLWAADRAREGVGEEGPGEPPKARLKRQVSIPSSAGSRSVGSPCAFNTDCVDGGYCENQLCLCYSTHIAASGGFCLRKINPNQRGCQESLQCSSVWPGATCSSGVCRCPFDYPPALTQDGPVCTLPGDCPTNGANPKLTLPNQDTLATCTWVQNAATGVLDWAGCLPDAVAGKTADCIPDRPRAAGPQAFDTGFCCPSRAKTCIQRRVSGSYQGTTTNTATRWWYNSITRACESFTYRGNGGNANNFESQAQCESYCLQTCERGNPQYEALSSSLSVATVNLWRYCTTTGLTGTFGGCGSNYRCDRIGTQQLCCPTPRFVCSEAGGIVPPQPPAGSLRGTNGRPLTRYRWTGALCQAFAYNGQAGDFNNFASVAECEEFCNRALCEQGQPLKDPSGSGGNYPCGSCPTTHLCTNSVCCPSVQTVCNQPINAGANCASGSSRYAFNAQTGACERFTYSGCQGNANNFLSIQDCQEYCQGQESEPRCPQGKALKDSSNVFYTCSSAGRGAANIFGAASTNVLSQCPSGFNCYFDSVSQRAGCCPTKAYTCARTFDAGRLCNPRASTRFYFDSSRGECLTFQYNGCDGNSNNFATKKDCEEYCGASGCPDGGEPLARGGRGPIVCSLTTKCPTNYQCSQVTRTSLAGTSQASSVSYCCPTKLAICSMATSRGVQCLSGSIQRWAYDASQRRCAEFAYVGCGGNSNNFPNRAACDNFCASAACEAGEQAAKGDDGEVQQCNPGTIRSCPPGFGCTRDTLNQRFVCCGAAADEGVCPAGQRPFVDAGTGEPRECIPNVAGNCPAAYICVFSTSRFTSFCCGTRGDPQCPGTGRVAIDPNTELAQACTLDATNVCPSGFACSETEAGAGIYGICCSGSSSAAAGVCGQGTVEILGGAARTCSPGSTVCARGYVCTPSATGTAESYCCDPLPSTNVCGQGTPYLNPNTGNRTPVTCSGATTGPNACPGGFQCQPSATGNGLSYCCTPSGAPSIYCGEASPYILPGTSGRAQSCLPDQGASLCPPSYVCELSAQLNQYFCCTGSGCPVGFEAFVDSVSGAVQSCASGDGDSACPTGYSCQSDGVAANSRCCRPSAVGFATCPDGSEAAIEDRTGQPRLCTPNSVPTAGLQPCPAGFACTAPREGGLGRPICCRSLADVCPAGFSPAPGGNGLPVSCTPGVPTGTANGCPSGQQCLTGSGGGAFCCREGGGGGGTEACGSPAIDAASGLPQSCASGCGDGLVCQGGLCCADGSALRCDLGATPYVDPRSGTSLACAAVGQQSVCPAGYPVPKYICVSLASALVCCPGALATCPSGTSPLIDAVTLTARRCATNADCSVGAVCTPSGRQSVCCLPGADALPPPAPPGLSAAQPSPPGLSLPSELSFQTSISAPAPPAFTLVSAPTRTLTCPTGAGPLLTEGRQRPCAPGVPDACPDGFACTSLGSSAFCCPSARVGLPGECPNGVESAKYVDGTPLECSFSQLSQCPPLYACVPSPRYSPRYICCRGQGPRYRVEPVTKAPSRRPRSFPTPALFDARIRDRVGRSCRTQEQCRGFGATCVRKRCRCSSNLVAYAGRCVATCPSFHRNVAGVCTSVLRGNSSEPFAALHSPGSPFWWSWWS